MIAIDDFAMFALSVVPTGPTTCQVVADMYVDEAMPADALEEWVSIYYTQTMQEDVQAVERQQAGFTAGAVTHGRLLPESETPSSSSRRGSGHAQQSTASERRTSGVRSPTASRCQAGPAGGAGLAPGASAGQPATASPEISR